MKLTGSIELDENTMGDLKSQVRKDVFKDIVKNKNIPLDELVEYMSNITPNILCNVLSNICRNATAKDHDTMFKSDLIAIDKLKIIKNILDL